MWFQWRWELWNNSIQGSRVQMCLERGTTDGWESGSVSDWTVTVQVFPASHLFLHVDLQGLVPMPAPLPTSCKGKVGTSPFKLSLGDLVLAGSCPLPHSWCSHVCVEDLSPCHMQMYSCIPSLHSIPFYQEHKPEQNFLTIYPTMRTGANNLYHKTAPPLTWVGIYLIKLLALSG